MSPALDRDLVVLAAGHPAQRRQRLALRPGGHQHHLLRRHRGGLVEGHHQPGRRRAAGRGRGRRPCCGPSSGRRRRPCACASRRSRAPAGSGARGWRSWRRSAAAMARANTSSSTGPMLRSGVTKPGTSALVESDSSRSMPASPSRAKAPRSVRTPSSGSWSILKSPVCTRRAGRGVHGDGERVGDRVVDRDELAVERPGHVVVARGDLDQRRVDPVLAQLGRDQREGEPRADQRDVLAQPQQVRDRADVVLVPVGEDDGVDVVEAVLDDAEVGQDQVDARLLGLGEQHAAVDDQQPARRTPARPCCGRSRRARRAP